MSRTHLVPSGLLFYALGAHILHTSKSRQWAFKNEFHVNVCVGGCVGGVGCVGVGVGGGVGHDLHNLKVLPICL